MYKFIWLVPLLPLAGAAINGIFGRWFRFPEKLVGGIAVASVALSFLISVAAIYSYGFSGNALWPSPYVSTQTAFIWIPGGAVRTTMGESTQGPETTISIANQQVIVGSNRSSLLNVEWSYQLDPLSAIFMLIVTGVGLCIFVFATGYMHGDTGFYRFFAYMGLFMFSMLVLVMGSNFVMMFVGWEGVGLCSYLLIGYYFNREEAANASRKAFITNRIGDFGFILAIFAVIATFGSAQYTDVIQKAAGYPVEALGNWGLMSWIALGLMIGACGKSAQFPLHVWLPDAMAGPTPVSALIHAATMVTAGVYMVARLSFLYVQAPGVMAVVAAIGVLTALIGALIGTSQMDIKRVLAYSTVSQLGYMFVGVGVGAFAAGTAHLITHAFFKACLFLGSGAVMHGLHGEQDMARMGGLRRLGLKHTAATFFIATVAITGVLPISGFFSKDEILAQALNTRAFDFLTAWDPASTSVPLLRPLLEALSRTRLTFFGPAVYLVGTVTALITSFYMWRCYLLTFEGEYRGPPEVHPHEAPWVMTLPLWVLAALSVVGALIVLPSRQLPFTWEHFTEGVFARPRGGAPLERLPELVAFGIALVVAWAGFAAAWSLYAPGRGLQGDERIARATPRLRRALASALYVDALYDRILVKPLWATARGLWRAADAMIIDGLLVNGSAQLVAAVGSALRRFQNGDVQRYAAVTAVGVLILVYVFLVRG